jgi:hypothetical protein
MEGIAARPLATVSDRENLAMSKGKMGAKKAL